jgi:cysteine-rich repeat protein
VTEVARIETGPKDYGCEMSVVPTGCLQAERADHVRHRAAFATTGSSTSRVYFVDRIYSFDHTRLTFGATLRRMRRIRWGVALFTLVVVAAACGDNIKLTSDAAVPDGPAAVCGNYKVEPGEDCDDGNRVTDSICDSDCHYTCGNGVLDTDAGESCDTAISSGDGACVTSCDDNQACTNDVLSGSECAAACIHSAITDPADGDGCCPTGANANNDDDCSAMCGNGILEPGELCDPGITAGAGACPASCDDGVACTTDTLMNPASCQATCSHTAITNPANGDGCCPAGATTANDNDCLPGCGNGVVDPGETCDTAITTGAGKCPTTCNDGMVCTNDVLVNAGTCTVVCTYPPITMPINGDGCCPSNANANNDTDCTPTCGNGVVEAGEQCDDGNTNNNDTCTNACRLGPTAFRFNTLSLRDPHVFVSVVFCLDVTDTQVAGFSVNSAIQKSLQNDNDMPPDGKLDLSPTIVFRPLTQTNAATTALDFYFADCTSPMATTSCAPGTTAPASVTATVASAGTCLAPFTGTTHPYTPAITKPTGPCFASSATTITLTLAGIPITLHDARIAATYSGSPATNVVNGLLEGFISETDANATILPSSLPLVGGQPLSSILAGGTGSCQSSSDKDVDNGVTGWWFYLNFTAPKVPWTDP